MAYILTIDASTQKAMAEAAAPYLGDDDDYAELERILTAMLSRRWPMLDVKVIFVYAASRGPQLRFGVEVAGVLDQGLIFSARPPDA